MSTDRSNLYKLIDRCIRDLNVRDFSKGEMVEGVIVKMSDSFIIVKVDNTFDVIVPASEIAGDQALKVGEKTRVFMMKEDEFGNLIASQKRTTPSQRWELLEKALETGETVVVEVVEANNGGVLVTIDGVMGFIPTSQLDPNRLYKVEGVTDSPKEVLSTSDIMKRLSELIGARIKVKVVEIDKAKSRIIFSEKMALNDSSREAKEWALSTFKVGDVLDGVVTAITNYGIFVNAQGLDGLVHVSEISWDKVENPLDYAKVGDAIKVKLIDLGENGSRVAYSIKQLTPDPWQEASADLKVGARVKGIVSEIEDYGLILRLKTGVTGLVHRSEVSEEHVGDLRDLFKVGQELEAVILTISPSERKMGLSLKRLDSSGSSKKGSKKSDNELRKAKTRTRSRRFKGIKNTLSATLDSALGSQQ